MAYLEKSGDQVPPQSVEPTEVVAASADQPNDQTANDKPVEDIYMRPENKYLRLDFLDDGKSS